MSVRAAVCPDRGRTASPAVRSPSPPAARRRLVFNHQRKVLHLAPEALRDERHRFENEALELITRHKSGGLFFFVFFVILWLPWCLRGLRALRGDPCAVLERRRAVVIALVANRRTARKRLRPADPPPVQDLDVRCEGPLAGGSWRTAAVRRRRVVAFRDADPVRYAEDMPIDRQPGTPSAWPSTTFAVFRPTPGSAVSSSMSAGTSPPCSARSFCDMPISAFDFWRKKPVDRISFSSSGGGRRASARASGSA